MVFKKGFSSKQSPLLIGLAILGWLIAGLALVAPDILQLGGAAGRSTCNLDFPVTCEGGDLSGQDLSETDFSYGRLRSTNMNSTTLNKANFFMADLTGVQLVEADLTGANFASASLTSADLTDADLTGALFVSDLDLLRIQLDGVLWSNTICPDGTNSDDHHNTCLNNLLYIDAGSE